MALPRRNPQASNPPNGRPNEGTGGQSGNHADNSRITNRPLPTGNDGADLVQRPKSK